MFDKLKVVLRSGKAIISTKNRQKKTPFATIFTLKLGKEDFYQALQPFLFLFFTVFLSHPETSVVNPLSGVTAWWVV